MVEETGAAVFPEGIFRLTLPNSARCADGLGYIPYLVLQHHCTALLGFHLFSSTYCMLGSRTHKEGGGGGRGEEQ